MYLYHEWVYRGPVFSVVWGYLSPVYYYLLFPFHYFSKFHPLSSPFASVIFNLAAIALAGFFTYKIFGKISALFVLILMGFSSSYLMKSYDGLNPTLIPPFAVLGFYSLYKVLNGHIRTYFSLLAFCLAMMIALHPSGAFWLLPLVSLYFIYKPKIGFKSLIFPSLIFGVFGILPYIIQEKKLAWWTIKQFIAYIKSGQTQDLQPTMWNYFSNFIVGTSKNISSVLFYSESNWSIIISIFILLFITIKAFGIFKNKNKYNYSAFFLFTYLLNFGLLVKFAEPDSNMKWFYAIFIPLFLIFLGISLAKIFHSKYWVFSVLFIIVFLTINLNAYFNITPEVDTYSYQKIVASVLKKDSQGSDFDIYGLNPEPTYYMMWYVENDSNLKEKYFSWIKWAKEKDSDLVYFVQASYDLKQEKLESIANEHGIENITPKILYISESGKKVYRIEGL